MEAGLREVCRSVRIGELSSILWRIILTRIGFDREDFDPKGKLSRS